MSSTNKQQVRLFWFRRDLRLQDNPALFKALTDSPVPVLPIFIFDRDLLEKLPERDDPRVSFIYEVVSQLHKELSQLGSGLLIWHDTVLRAFREILNQYDVESVYINRDYEPYARQRDDMLAEWLKTFGIPLRSFKDHVIYEMAEVMKSDGTPYTVFTAYKRVWLHRLSTDFPTLWNRRLPYHSFLKGPFPPTPELAELGFTKSTIEFPGKEYHNILANYSSNRNFPALKGTTHLGIHLRFGTISIRTVLADTLAADEKTLLSELIWRDFYAMILWHFPWTVNQAFKPAYDHIRWRNNEAEFNAWCEGRTGYPLVDAGMRELNSTGFMHNRVRMITASFLTKHLLIDWRWGETYFAQKLLDYEQASNVGGWQWAAGSGQDAAPYFRIFNPDLQAKKFDPQLEYIKKWVPEFKDPSRYPAPIVDHRIARERALAVYKEALGSRA